MAKYSFEFKLKVVQEYLGGKGSYGVLTKKYQISTDRQLKTRVNVYNISAQRD